MDEATRALVEEIADASAQKAVRATFTALGVDIEEASDIRDFQADMLHLRKWRKSMEEMQSKGMMAAVGFVVTGLMAVLWLGIKTKFGLGS